MIDPSDRAAEPVTIVKIDQPICGNVFGSAPCGATGAACYQTYATCTARETYRDNVETLLAPAFTHITGEAIALSEDARGASFFAGFDLSFSADPEGAIWCQGDAAAGVFLGVTGSEIVFRLGDGSAAAPSDGVVDLRLPVAILAGRAGSLFARYDAGQGAASLWFADGRASTLEALGSVAFTGSAPALWSGSDAGALGVSSADIAGESSADFNGIITQARFYPETLGPDMDVSFYLPLYYGRAGRGRPSDALYVMPFLLDVSVSPGLVNISTADKNFSPLGMRASARITMQDGIHTDRLVDPYLSTRTYDPLTLGTHFSKWNTRNKFGKVGAPATVYTGFAGRPLSEFQKRRFVTSSLDFSGSGLAVFDTRDALIKASDEAAQIPRLSPGALFADVLAGALSLEVSGAVLADYAAAGSLRVRDEVLTYSAVTLNDAGRLDFTLIARGTDGTAEASRDHGAGDPVQECFRLVDAPVDGALRAIISGFTTIPDAQLNLLAWAVERDAYLAPYLLTGLVTSPEPVKTIVGEILEQVQAFLWHDLEENRLELQALRPITTRPRTFTAERHILADSLSLEEKPKERASQVWMYFEQRNPAKAVREASNYARLQSSPNLALEAPAAYGRPAVRKIFARFIRGDAVALEITARILTRYQDIPVAATFAVAWKDSDLALGEMVYLSDDAIQDKTGARDIRPWIITSKDPDLPGERVVYVAEDASLSGVLSVIMADGSADYVGDGSDPFAALYISADDGKMPNGDPAPLIN
jgi:hypothetical protein